MLLRPEVLPFYQERSLAMISFPMPSPRSLKDILMPVVLVPSSLRRYTEQQSRVTIAGNTVSAILKNLTETASEMRSHLFASDKLRHFVVISKNGQDIRLLQGLETPVDSADEIRILASIAGG
jgi:molybdopterin synthase sulfur carrier subunit